MDVVKKTGVKTNKKNNWKEKRALYLPEIMKEESSDTTFLRENRWRSRQQDAWPVTSTNFPRKQVAHKLFEPDLRAH